MRHFAICLLCLSLTARAEPLPVVQSELLPVPQAAAPAAPALQPPGATLRSRISDDAIRKAVKETLDTTWENPRRYENDTMSATPYDSFGREFSEARVPDCLHADGLKRQPTFFLGGALALPFIAVAKLRGKCN
ncbi:hypothetical protein [Massilia brevitalea]|uniref:hypothetical protein n=1 Tax=Massilia brevitalea TaxID=442526 RepID=UPI002738AE62|nr:hypothetical protein [Massilia brevitalea]